MIIDSQSTPDPFPVFGALLLWWNSFSLLSPAGRLRFYSHVIQLSWKT